MRIAARTALALLLMTGVVLGETKVLENFTLIDGAGGSPVSNAALVVSDGRIDYAGPKTRLKAPVGAQRIDLTGKYVIPGIINLHGHIGNVKELTQDPKFFTRENVNKQLSTYASYGVTSVVSMGADPDLVYQMRAEQRAGRPTVARIFTAGKGFTGKAGYPTQAPGMQGVPFEVESAADVRKAVAQLADKRVDVIKVWVDDHLGREDKISMDLCRAIIESAHKYGIKVAAHIFYLEDAKELVEAGLDGLAHSVRDKPVDEELIALMKKRGAWQAAATLTREVSTFVYAKHHPFLDDPFFNKSVTPSVLATLKSDEYQENARKNPDLDKLPGFLETAKRNLRKLHDAGVNIGFGTDTGPPGRFSGYFEQWEMELMAELGIKPADVIHIATGRSAEFLGVAGSLGTLEKGKWADLVVLSANPLEDIRNTRAIETVWIAGNKAN